MTKVPDWKIFLVFKTDVEFVTFLRPVPWAQGGCQWPGAISLMEPVSARTPKSPHELPPAKWSGGSHFWEWSSGVGHLSVWGKTFDRIPYRMLTFFLAGNMGPDHPFAQSKNGHFSCWWVNVHYRFVIFPSFGIKLSQQYQLSFLFITRLPDFFFFVPVMSSMCSTASSVTLDIFQESSIRLQFLLLSCFFGFIRVATDVRTATLAFSPTFFLLLFCKSRDNKTDHRTVISTV